MLKKEWVNSTESGWLVIKTKNLREKNNNDKQTKNKKWGGVVEGGNQF